MANKIIAANWKMNMNNRKALRFVGSFKNPQPKKAEVIIAAPFTVLPSLSVIQKGFSLAAQDVSAYEEGAYTGEISAAMLKELGVRYCLVGHSERRVYHKETDKEVAQKIEVLQKNQITPILCFGENADERRKKQTRRVLSRQLQVGLSKVKSVKNIILAYEPVWAISSFQKAGVKKRATDDDIIQAHAFVKNWLLEKYGKKGGDVTVLYGGSADEKNSKSFINEEMVDGVLVGSAALKISSFSGIIKNIQ